MSRFDLDLAEIEDGTETLLGREYSDEKTLEIKAAYRLVKARFDSGESLTLEDQKVIIEHARADREEKFVLNAKAKSAKAPRERKAKKVSRANLVLLLEKLEEELTEDEIKDRDHSLTLYKGRKISGKSLNKLFLLEAKEGKLNKLDEMDKQLAMFGSLDDD